MTKITITKKQIDMVGEVVEGNVKPFGTSAHIPFSKKHMGKIVKVIVPSEANFVWLLTDKDRARLLITARNIILKENGKLESYRLELLENLSERAFNLDDLVKIIKLLESHNKEKVLVSKVKKAYNL
ncbi:hypothetical protein LCGC14_1385410 [marine sediment metagenome]|uniref:Uncharacterized protein n=1 Tax=marine sediment metagenome TaxID=412755 RepID=A0A0F9K1J3_9ZZZZ